MLDDSIAAPTFVQPLQHHRSDRDQRLRNAPVFLHDAQNLWKGTQSLH